MRAELKLLKRRDGMSAFYLYLYPDFFSRLIIANDIWCETNAASCASAAARLLEGLRRLEYAGVRCPVIDLRPDPFYRPAGA